jgi:hypothetical protein
VVQPNYRHEKRQKELAKKKKKEEKLQRKSGGKESPATDDAAQPLQESPANPTEAQLGEGPPSA